MPKITFIHPDDRRETFDVAVGVSLMQGATSNAVDGIVAECGGNAVCATCHVFIEPDQLDRLESMDDEEDNLLDGTATERQPNSRLSCQIPVTAALDGLVVRLPERQV